LRHHATGLTWGWNIAVPDDERRAAELLGVLEYDGPAPGRGVVTDFEMTTFPGLTVEASVIWQHTERRSVATNYATRVDQNLDAAAFHATNRAWREQGFRATDIEVYDTPAGVRFVGVWMTNLEGAEWSVHHGLTSAAFGDLFEERRAAGFRLVDIEIYQTAGGQRHAAIWVRSCDNTNWREFRGMSRDGYQRRVDSLITSGFRVIDFESYRTPAGQRYAAIWEQRGPQPPVGPPRYGDLGGRALEPARRSRHHSPPRLEPGAQSGRHRAESPGAPALTPLWRHPVPVLVQDVKPRPVRRYPREVGCESS
jgi:hypothetical protein